MTYHLMAYAKLHFDGVLLPYKVLLDLERQEHDGEFKEVPPNPFYPNPAVTIKTEQSRPNIPDCNKDLPLNKFGLPDYRADAEFKAAYEEYERRVESEKMQADKWAFYYTRFLLPYDISSFTDFDFWGEIPKSEEEKNAVQLFREMCIKTQANCRDRPQEFNLEPILRLEEHRQIYDVGYGYI